MCVSSELRRDESKIFPDSYGGRGSNPDPCRREGAGRYPSVAHRGSEKEVRRSEIVYFLHLSLDPVQSTGVPEACSEFPGIS